MKLRPISPRRLQPPKPLETPSTERPLANRLRLEPLAPTWSKANQIPPSTRFLTSSPRRRRILDFDIETRAAGFGDPNWVPQEVTAIAWSWCGEEDVFYSTQLDGEGWMSYFLMAYADADILTGHNILRFDLPVLQADLLRKGYPPLLSRLVQDTMRIIKTKGFKKGQDNISTLLENPIQKMPLNWQEWDDAYRESDWRTVIDRVTSDVQGHKILRQRMLERGWLRPIWIARSSWSIAVSFPRPMLIG